MKVSDLTIGSVLVHRQDGTKHRVRGIDLIGPRGCQPRVHVDGRGVLPEASIIQERELVDYKLEE